MTDTFGRQFSTLADKLKIDPKKDAALQKALDGVSKAHKQVSDDFHDTVTTALGRLGTKKRETKEKDDKKAIEALETLMKSDIEKRYTLKDKSGSPS